MRPASHDSYLRLLFEFPNYRRLYAARSISLLGDWFNLLALLTLLRETTENSGQIVGALFIVKLLPTFFMGPIAGVIADRFSRVRVMVYSDLTRFFLTLCYLAIPLLEHGHLWAIYGLTILHASASAFFEPARTAMLPSILPSHAIVRANALGAMTWSAIYALGAGLGGLVNQWLGWQITLALDASTFAVSAFIVARIDLPAQIKRVVSRTWLELLGFKDMLAGFVYMRQRRQILFCALIKSGWCLAGAIQLVLTLYGTHIYHFGGRPDLGMASLFVCRALGTAAGPLVARRICGEDPRKMTLAIIISFFASAAAYIAFAQVSHVYLAFAFVFIAHMGGSTIWVFSTVLLQWNVDNEFRGRVFASEIGMATLLISLSTWVIGGLHDRGLALTSLPLILGCILFFSGLMFAYWYRSLNAQPRPEP